MAFVTGTPLRQKSRHALRVPSSTSCPRKCRPAPSAILRGAGQDMPRKIRVAIPSKGNMFEETKRLLSEIGADVIIHNPRQYVAGLSGMDAELWLQRPPDIVRKVREGDVDLGFVGGDLVAEYGGDSEEVVVVHGALGYGSCRLAVGIPMAWDAVSCMAELKAMSCGRTLRVATKFSKMCKTFMDRHAIENYRVVNMEGALEAATQMGTADFIVDLVSSGVTLRENLLKEVHDGTILDSSMQLVGNRGHLSEDSAFGEQLRKLTRELLERTEAHLLGRNMYNVIANIRGSSMVDVGRKLGGQTDLRGVDGPTISPVVPPADFDSGMYAISIVVPKSKIYSAVQQLRKVGGSGVTVLPVTYVFEEDSVRWQSLVDELGVSTMIEALQQ